MVSDSDKFDSVIHFCVIIDEILSSASNDAVELVGKMLIAAARKARVEGRLVGDPVTNCFESGVKTITVAGLLESDCDSEHS